MAQAHIKKIDRAVRVAGINVYPEHAAKIPREYPDVRECAVRPMAGRNGTRLKAFIVSKPGSDPRALLEKVSNFARERLSNAEFPASITIGDALPRNEMGKLADWDIL